MDKQFKQAMTRKAHRIVEAYKYALRTDNWKEYFQLFAAFADECEENHVDPEAFFSEKKFKSLDFSFGI